MNGLASDDIVGIIGILMCLTLVGANLFGRDWRSPRTSWAKLAGLAILWAAIIAIAAILFQHLADHHLT